MNKHEAILPDGTVAKRNSQNRVYPFCIAVKRSFVRAMKDATDERWREIERGNWRCFKGRNFNGYNGDPSPLEIEASGFENADDFAEYKKGVAVDSVTKALDDGFYDRWFVVTWCGRRDLAEKQLASAQANDCYAEARIVETNHA